MSSDACCLLPQEISISASDAMNGLKESIATDLVKHEVLVSVKPGNLTQEVMSSSDKIGNSSQEAVVATKTGNLTPEALAKAASAAEVHVLAVDDSILDRKVIEKLLKTSSYKVTTVDSGNKALEFLGLNGDQSSMQINISLIITDYCMPGMTGYELLKRVKETSALKEIPVVIMSSENIPNRIQRCLEEGAKEFIMKPVQMSDVERIKSYIRPMPKTCEQQSGLSCNKRKFDTEGFQGQGAERRPRLSGLTVA